MKYKLSAEQLRKIIQALTNGQRVELIPLKDHVKILEVSRKEIE